MTTATAHPAPWVADNGDGTYRNPVLHADWSDPDVIRVGADFYLVASSFHRVPGLPILHSRDLVNWTILGHALDRLEPGEMFDVPRPGRGVWAPSIRYHEGRFWIFYPDPDQGIFVVTATEPAGPWSPPRRLKAGRGLIDPCPLWTEEGAFLVHAWAKSRAGFNNKLTCHRMAPDATRLLDSGRFVIDGDALPGYRTLEGPKMYHRDGWYWIFAPAGGVAHGWQSAFRSRDPFGPYEDRIVLAQGDTPVNGPHQGAWVTTPAGQDWFLHFQQKGAFGRVVHLQPMRWEADGWPLIGTPAPGAESGEGPLPGRPVLRHAKPVTAVDGAPVAQVPFGPQWTWPANPRPEWWASRPGGGSRLHCVPTDTTGDLRRLPNLWGQRLPADRFRATASLRLTAEAAGARAGMAIVGSTYAWLGLLWTERGPMLVHRRAGDSERDAMPPIPVPNDSGSATVVVAVEVDPDARCRFFASVVPQELRPLGEPFQATPGHWVGATLGLFATAPPGTGPVGSADIDDFRITT